MIEETYAVFAAWDFAAFQAREPRPVARRELHRRGQRHLVARRRQGAEPALRSRGRDRPLVVLGKDGLPVDEWKPLLLWHMTRDEFLSATSSRTGCSPPTKRALPRSPRGGPGLPRRPSQARRHHRARLDRADDEARRRGAAQDGGGLRPAARQRRQGVRVVPPAGAQLPLPAARDARREAEPRQGRRARPTGACS